VSILLAGAAILGCAAAAIITVFIILLVDAIRMTRHLSSAEKDGK
jgi:hypothetical protein